THGFVVAGDGRKMSKSLGNVIAPQEVSDSLGAEILRLWVGATDYSGELSISNEILKRVVESYRRIRNTLRFLLANLSDFDPATHAVPVVDWVRLDRYAVALAARFQEDLAGHYARYEFHLVTQKLQTFCSEDLSAFYLDVLKDRLYTARADSLARRSAQSALHHITSSLLRLMAPVLLARRSGIPTGSRRAAGRLVFLPLVASVPADPGRSRPPPALGGDPRGEGRGPEGAREPARRGKDRLLARRSRRDPSAQREVRRPRAPRGRFALRHVDFAGDHHPSRRGGERG